MLARMALVVTRRRLPEDTALGLLKEMLDELGIPGIEFANQENWPGHPLGDLIAEAFGHGRKFPILASLNPGHPPNYRDPHSGDHGDGEPWSQEQEDAETEAYYIVLDRFSEHFKF